MCATVTHWTSLAPRTGIGGVPWSRTTLYSMLVPKPQTMSNTIDQSAVSVKSAGCESTFERHFAVQSGRTISIQTIPKYDHKQSWVPNHQILIPFFWSPNMIQTVPNCNLPWCRTSLDTVVDTVQEGTTAWEFGVAWLWQWHSSTVGSSGSGTQLSRLKPRETTSHSWGATAKISWKYSLVDTAITNNEKNMPTILRVKSQW